MVEWCHGLKMCYIFQIIFRISIHLRNLPKLLTRIIHQSLPRLIRGNFLVSKAKGKISGRVPEYPEHDFSTSTRITWKFHFVGIVSPACRCSQAGSVRSILTTPKFECIQYLSISLVYNGLCFNFHAFVNNSG